MTRRRIEDLAAVLDRACTVRQEMFRLEILQEYDVSYEQEAVTAFLRDGAVDLTPGPWQALVARHSAAGRVCRRVRVVQEPWTDYLRYELAAPYARSQAAGELIGVLVIDPDHWPPPGWPTGTDRTDFWLFDDEVWIMRYDDEGRFVAVDVDDDPQVLADHRQVAATAVITAAPLDVYLQDHHRRHRDPPGSDRPSPRHQTGAVREDLPRADPGA